MGISIDGVFIFLGPGLSRIGRGPIVCLFEMQCFHGGEDLIVVLMLLHIGYDCDLALFAWVGEFALPVIEVWTIAHAAQVAHQLGTDLSRLADVCQAVVGPESLPGSMLAFMHSVVSQPKLVSCQPCQVESLDVVSPYGRLQRLADCKTGRAAMIVNADGETDAILQKPCPITVA